jgi:hypothetical protein
LSWGVYSYDSVLSRFEYGINHLHHSNHCSNHSIDIDTVTSYLDGWKTTTLSERDKPNSTSQRMERLVSLLRLLG